MSPRPEFKQYDEVIFNGMRSKIVAVNPISKTFNIRTPNSLAQNIEAKDVFVTYEDWQAANADDPIVQKVDLLANYRPPVAPIPAHLQTPRKPTNKPSEVKAVQGDQFIAPMSKIEAQSLVNQIRSGMNAVHQKVLQLYEHEGWKALGYATWRDCVIAEFDFSQSRAYQLLDAARVERNISTNGGNLPAPTSERQIRPLVGLEPAQQVEAYSNAVEKNNGDVPSGAQVEAAVAEFKAETALDPTSPSESQNSVDLAEKSSDPKPAPTPLPQHRSDSNEWYTPVKYLDAVREVLEVIDLDPASCEVANQNVKAEEFYAAADDGFTKRWRGRVFLNPPYGKDEDTNESNAGRWAARLISAYESAEIDEAILLVNASTGAEWFQGLWEFPICFVNGRISFINSDGEKNQPTHYNVFVYFGTNARGFEEAFAKLGVIR